MLGLYLHVPFCSAICNYCNFNRGLFDSRLKERFVQALQAELAAVPRQLESDTSEAAWEADTIYFGGGTPSLLTPGEIASILSASRQSYTVTRDAEVTVEANPESVDERSLEGLREAGVNRLSFGVQSFRDDELQRLGRLHTAGRAIEAVRMARGAGFNNISIDLMMWLPGQSLEQWLESVEQAIAVGPDHLSLYILEVYPHLPLKQQMTHSGWLQASEDEAADMYESAMELLEAHDYSQYEISNVARPERKSRHNLKYWTDGEWLGFGPGAHSTWHGARWRNVATTEDYIEKTRLGGSVRVDRRTLSDDERLGDALFTGLRLNAGIDAAEVSRRYGTDIWQRYGSSLQEFQRAGLLIVDGERIRLTRHGMLLANEVMSIFV